ncbi:hypothetical protein BISU_1026 [Bifidobacterium subtile]|uniref:Uncharacterized protein n=1 Tax=Bifidobacterium subtile TaxID=77635 RepID=A0A087E5P7_9BIFI|nr:hypothetical protein BISU_1026 [Bifidobacterium subtile]
MWVLCAAAFLISTIGLLTLKRTMAGAAGAGSSEPAEAS